MHYNAFGGPCGARQGVSLVGGEPNWQIGTPLAYHQQNSQTSYFKHAIQVPNIMHLTHS